MICINTPPFMNHSCQNQTAINHEYFCDIDAVTNQGESVAFYDDTPLFEINSSTGIINFTPSESDIGEQDINLTAADNSTCSNNNATLLFFLNITTGMIEQAINLTITRVGLHSAMLNWSSVPGAYNYTVYYSSNLTLVRMNMINKMSKEEGITDTYWIDPTASDASERYYRVGIIADASNISNETAGKLDLQFISNTDGSLGRNLFSIPFNATYYADPFISEICDYGATLTRLDRENANYENYESHSCASGPYNNFSLDLGKGYFAYVNASYNYTVVGLVPPEDITLHLVSNPSGTLGRNLFGLHFPESSYYADNFLTPALCGYGATVTRLNRENANYENYESHSCASGSYNNYTIEPGQGFYVYVNTTYDYAAH